MRRGINQKHTLKKMLRRKLQSRGGETLAEVLVGILFVAVASSLFLNMVTVSGRINTKTQKSDDIFYKAMSLLECFEADGEIVYVNEGRVKVSLGSGGSASQDYNVKFYYGDGMISYQANTGTEDVK